MGLQTRNYEQSNAGQRRYGLSEEIKIEAFMHPEIRAKECWIKYEERLGNTKLLPLKHGMLNLLYLFKIRLKLRNPADFLKLDGS